MEREEPVEGAQTGVESGQRITLVCNAEKSERW